jgi:hypothetical protein
MYQLGGNVSYFASQLLSNTMRYDGGDSTYVFTGGKSAGLIAALYFDKGGYYSKKVYGIKLETNFCQVDQSYKFFPGQGIIDPDVFYRYRIKLSYIDIPLLFTMCPTHHQGLTFEVGPQISFLNKAKAVLEEYKNTSPIIPVVNTHTFNPITFGTEFEGPPVVPGLDKFKLKTAAPLTINKPTKLTTKALRVIGLRATLAFTT